MEHGTVLSIILLFRDKLRTRLEEMERSITEEEETVEKMNEEKMINALDSNVKLGSLQAVFDKVISVDMSSWDNISSSWLPQPPPLQPSLRTKREKRRGPGWRISVNSSLCNFSPPDC